MVTANDQAKGPAACGRSRFSAGLAVLPAPTFTDNDMDKCDKDGCCNHLAERLGDGGKGFKALHTVKRDSNVTRFFGVAYKTSAKDNGLLLNWCPFCGGQPGYFERTEDMPANV